MFFCKWEHEHISREVTKRCSTIVTKKMPWYKLVNCGLIVVVCGGCQEVVDMYFHTQLGAPREPPADTNASCKASLLWAGLDFPIIIICVFKPSSTYFCDQYDHRLLYQSKHWTSSFQIEIRRILTKNHLHHYSILVLHHFLLWSELRSNGGGR